MLVMVGYNKLEYMCACKRLQLDDYVKFALLTDSGLIKLLTK